MWFRNLLFWIFLIASVFIAGFFAFVSFSEWFTVGYKGNSGGYPWGPVNDNPWYYASPLTYSKVMLIESIILALGLCFTFYLIVKRNKEKILYGLLGLWTIVIALIVNGQIKP